MAPRYPKRADRFGSQWEYWFIVLMLVATWFIGSSLIGLLVIAYRFMAFWVLLISLLGIVYWMIGFIVYLLLLQFAIGFIAL